ncbi:GNAT family N-acetyltransferase [Kribbella lupini]|uniref:GNAT family N-acetyltransferase n=1 Tax=Kribbella lupini TaxID=291602 RepID=A0ABN2B659_9ACTN
MNPNIELLSDHHDVTKLDCGIPQLDEWLRKTARISNERDLAKTYVIADENGVVVAYSALVASSIESTALTSRARHGLPTTLPAVLLGKLAVDMDHRGLGSHLLGHACRIAVAVREIIGARFLFADALNETARNWYLSKDMKAVAGSNVCYARIKDLAG